ncbi:hypothetical protein Taro_017493 [Colocasia esculenta]|uniref:Uncharacterized protein n=1 Tax=Colocasia esculenta TaxID=4460 RepID=A0A843UGC2_COLES|nr:hypothetical protein [Colocasia esculenta]
MLGAHVVRLWSHMVTPVFRELLCLGGCFRMCFDSAGSTGVIFGLTRVVIEACTMFPLLCNTLQ